MTGMMRLKIRKKKREAADYWNSYRDIYLGFSDSNLLIGTKREGKADD